jgi:hypothetical protein
LKKKVNKVWLKRYLVITKYFGGLDPVNMLIVCDCEAYFSLVYSLNRTLLLKIAAATHYGLEPI